MRKITSYYYLNYPDALPSEPLDAYSEVYVEIGDKNATIDKFDETFSFHVYTLRRLKRVVEEKGSIVLRSVIIVDRFDDKRIEKALDGILGNIEQYGSKVGA